MIVVFDAQCLLCNGWVKFLLRHDRKGVFRFASIQGIAGQTLLAQANLKVEGLETLLLIDGQRIWQHTGAIFRVLGAWDGPGDWHGSAGWCQRRSQNAGPALQLMCALRSRLLRVHKTIRFRRGA